MGDNGLKATNLRALRQGIGKKTGKDVTQEALARKSGISLRTYIRIEKCESAPQTQTAFAILDGLLACGRPTEITELFKAPA